jgi:hypothetical protein
MFEGVGRKKTGRSGGIREKTAGNLPRLQNTSFGAGKRRNFTTPGNQRRFSPPAPAMAALICRASWAISRSMPVGATWKPQK